MSLKGMSKMEFYTPEDYLVPNGCFQDGLERYITTQNYLKLILYHGKEIFADFR